MTTSTHDSHKAIKIQRGIREAEDTLVLAIQEALDPTKHKYGDLEESQFRNLVSVADNTQSTEVIKNFLLYQVGRDQKWGRGKESLANRIIADIDGPIKKKAQDIAQSVNTQEFRGVWLNLIRLYLGYGARYLTYLRKGKV